MTTVYEVHRAVDQQRDISVYSLIYQYVTPCSTLERAQQVVSKIAGNPLVFRQINNRWHAKAPSKHGDGWQHFMITTSVVDELWKLVHDGSV